MKRKSLHPVAILTVFLLSTWFLHSVWFLAQPVDWKAVYFDSAGNRQEVLRTSYGFVPRIPCPFTYVYEGKVFQLDECLVEEQDMWRLPQ